MRTTSSSVLKYLSLVLLFTHFCCASAISPATTPQLQYINASTIIGVTNGNKYGFEGGTVLLDRAAAQRLGVGPWFLFTSEMYSNPKNVNMRLAAWASASADPFGGWQRVATLYTSTGNFNGTDPRAALWAPMPFYHNASATYHLFYVAYRCAPNNSSGWYSNFDGRIVHAISTVSGPAGIVGPYRDISIALQPDSQSQPWEGLQGTDSISPPFARPGAPSANQDLLAFYGSCHSEAPPPPPYNSGRWNVGLASLSIINATFQRLPFPNPNPVNFNGGYAENPIVTWAPQHQLLLAVFDSLNTESQGFGLASSGDGVNWTAETLIQVPEGARTPMRLEFMDADESTAVVFYSRVNATSGYETVEVATFNVSWG